MPKLTRRESWALLRDALEAMPVKELGYGDMFPDGLDACGCAVGEMVRAQCRKTGLNLHEQAFLDAKTLLNISILTLMNINGFNDAHGDLETPAARWERMHALAVREAQAEEVGHG